MTPAARKYLESNRSPFSEHAEYHPDRPIQPAIKLRCDIAARALQGMLASTRPGEDWPKPEVVATLCVVYADWLLEMLAK